MSTIDPKWVVNLKGKDYPQWPGVLDAATTAGLRSLKVQLIQAPAPENAHTAIVLARAEFEDGRVFEDLGDASPANCSAQIATAAIRMASTRAKGRVCRDALNIGQTMWEELPDEEKAQALGAQRANGGPARVPDRSGERPAVLPTDMAIKHGPPCAVCGAVVSANVYRASEKEFGRTFCLEHGKAERKRRAAASEPAAQPGAAVG